MNISYNVATELIVSNFITLRPTSKMYTVGMCT